ncbi:MAG: hypothetical protein U9P79_06040 [Candidatus Cloacimonadota bacterium]|nr:hypothetical protein [Candidatus Cloacimonadota bacterium]
MDNAVKLKIEKFNFRLKHLYEEVSKWVNEEGLCVKEIEKINLEEKSGKYKTKKLLILKDNTKIAQLNPIGIWIIGAKGRVDLESDISKQIFAYLSEDKPGTEMSRTAGEDTKTKAFKYNYKDTREGWHWIDDRIIGKTPLIDKDVFLNVLDWIL